MLNRDYAEAYFTRGFIYINKGEVNKAIEDFNTAIQLNPNNAYAYHNRGDAYSDEAILILPLKTIIGQYN